MYHQYIVYGDILFFVNLVMDYFLLWATGRFGQFPTNWKRLAVAALCGACYGVGIIFPGLQMIYGLGMKLFFSILLLWLAFGFLPIKQFVKAIGCFYLISFAMAGAALGASSFLKTNIYNNGQSQQAIYLLFGMVAAVVLGHWGIRYWKRNWHKSSYRAQATIFADGQKSRFPVLLDSGNELYDPTSGKPVMVVEYQAVKKLFPAPLAVLLEKNMNRDLTAVLTDCPDPFWSKRLRLIPFQSLGRQHGMLLGFRPDWLSLARGGKEELQTKDVVICLSNQQLGRGNEYQGIVNIDIMTGLSLEGEILS